MAKCADEPRRPADFPRRDLDDDRDDPSLRLGRRRCTRHRPCPEWSLEDDDVSCRPHLRGVDCPFVLDGPINAECFFAYVEQILVPVLREGDTVILDNLSSHKSDEAARLIAGAGARLLFLPPYSPDLNPIEMAFAKFKELLRQAQARTVDALWDLIGRTLNLFTPEECRNYIRHCGYNPL